MKSWLSSKNISLVILGALIVYLTFNLSFDRTFVAIEDNIEEELTEQESLLNQIALSSLRGGDNDIVGGVIADCSTPERNDFNRFLNQLDSGLSNAELTELERLFGRCGAFGAERKSIIASRLTREIDVYEKFVTQLGLITSRDLSDRYQISDWKLLAKEEEQQSRLFAELVSLQDRIIITLLEGQAPTSPEITTILEEVSEVQENLQLATIKAAEIRDRLIEE